MTDRTPVFYTFGNHMHWVDMEWLWGYHVLPGSVRDMLHFCRETGAKGNVNFDGVGYEKLAIEDPVAFQELRDAVVAGAIEVVGGSYGQPYGGLHGGESNIRQRIYGVRTALRLFGVRPRTFWEEEFDFFPQLPQMLKGVGFDGASLFFQWTWHTPDVPFENSSMVLWEGHDGTRLRAASRGPLNLHQWPEDIDALLSSLDPSPDPDVATPLVLQWLELMPSPDWMCRSEVLLPKTKELLSDPRFDFRFGTLGEYLQTGDPDNIPVRRYGPDDVFHGISLGKNGDLFRRLSRKAEHTLLSAETFASVAGLLGRPYAQWDVYPTWELEESWRELLQAQHHDNDECEGLCGHVGRFSYERSLSLSTHILDRTIAHISQRIDAPPGAILAFNPLGWDVDSTFKDPTTGEYVILRGIPPMGWTAFSRDQIDGAKVEWTKVPGGIVGKYGDLEVTVDAKGRLSQIRNAVWPEGILDPAKPLFDFFSPEGDAASGFSLHAIEVGDREGGVSVRFTHPSGAEIRLEVSITPETSAIDVTVSATSLKRPHGGMASGIQTSFELASAFERIVTDSPYAVHEVQAAGKFKRKYPTGDWMTSEQWFEDIVNPFHSLSLVDLTDGRGAGLLVVHDGSQQWFRDGDRVRNLWTMYDPWDEDYWIDGFNIRYRLIPHGPMTNAERWRRAQEFLRPPFLRSNVRGGGDLPPTFCGLRIDSGDLVPVALYRETRESGGNLPAHAAAVFEADYPFVARVVEFNGERDSVRLRFPATVGRLSATNLLGENLTDLEAGATVPVEPHEIKTFTVDLIEARKQTRDLDSRREAWATVHRLDQED